MALFIGSIVINVRDLPAARDFWCAALGYQVREGREEAPDETFVVLTDPRRRWANISLQVRADPKPERNRLHLDLYSDDQLGEVERLVALGARRATWHYEAGDDFIVLLDPEDNEFCVIASPFTQENSS